ncbi:MAG: flavin reductase family protein [Bdellovibrionota bacterium]|nr:MAG: flavin reductase family protein [Bdellovibrionota bacterium]
MSSPNPNWKPGQTVKSPVSEMVTLDADKLSPPELYKLIIGAVVPRPIAFVSTCNSQGQVNLAPFSFFTGVSSNPPCLVFSVAVRPNGAGKDTLRNVQETGQFVVNSANEWLAEPLVHTAADFPYGVNEMEQAGLTPIASVKVRPPRVKESAVQFECEVYKTMPIGDGSPGSATLVVGRIVCAHVHKAAYDNGRIILQELRPVARLGGIGYCLVGNTFELPVPKIS